MAEAQMSLGCTPIDKIEIPTKTRAHIAALMIFIRYVGLAIMAYNLH